MDSGDSDHRARRGEFGYPALESLKKFHDLR